MLMAGRSLAPTLWERKLRSGGGGRRGGRFSSGFRRGVLEKTIRSSGARDLERFLAAALLEQHKKGLFCSNSAANATSLILPARICLSAFIRLSFRPPSSSLPNKDLSNFPLSLLSTALDATDYSGCGTLSSPSAHRNWLTKQETEFGRTLAMVPLDDGKKMSVRSTTHKSWYVNGDVDYLLYRLGHFFFVRREGLLEVRKEGGGGGIRRERDSGNDRWLRVTEISVQTSS